MSSQAPGLLAVWTDVEPAAEADFNQWYDHEHLGERAAHTGFRGSRRYVAEQGAPRYFAAYDTDSLAVLGSHEYVHALGNQTDWSKRVLARSRNMTRMVASLVGDHGIEAPRGLGAVILTLILTPAAGGAAKLAAALDTGALGKAAELPAVVRASVALGVLALPGGDAAEPPRRAAAAPDAVALLIEATHAPVLQELQAGPLSEAALRAAGAAGIAQQGLYRFRCAVLSAR